MPADDLVLNVRQVAQYPAAGSAPSTAALLMQLGIGGPYQSISPQALVSTALSTGGDMTINGALSALSFSGGKATFSNAAINLLWAQKACFLQFDAQAGSICGAPIATLADLGSLSVVLSFNGRNGIVTLSLDDITGAGGAPIESPDFSGLPTAPTAAPGVSTGQLATTAFVMNAVADSTTGVVSFNTRTGAVVLTSADVTGAGGALLASPTFTGVPLAPTAAPGANSAQLATTAFVTAAISAAGGGVTTFNGRSGAVSLIGNDISAAGGAVLASPIFTGTPMAPTAIAGNNSTQIATTAFVMAAIAGGGYAPLASPGLTGTPTAPTAAPGTNTTQLATTAFVTAAISAAGGAGVTTFNGRSGAVSLIANDISAAGGALLASPALTGVPSAPTAAPGVSTTQLATCAFVAAAVAGSVAGVSSFNTRIGAVTLTTADVTTALPASGTAPLMDGTASAGSSAAWSRGDHVHPNDTSRLPLTGGVLSGPITFNVTGLGAAAGLNSIAIGGFLTSAQDPSGWTPNSYASVPFAMNNGATGYLMRTIATAGSTWPIHVVYSNPTLTTATGVLQAASFCSWSIVACDERVKQDLAPASDALAAVNSVPVYSATYARSGVTSRERWIYTLLAQEVRSALPFAYMEPPEGGYASLHPLHLIATLWRAVQELSASVSGLEREAAS